MNITTDGNGASDRLDVGLLHEDFPSLDVSALYHLGQETKVATKTDLVTQLFHLVLAQRLALHELSDPSIDVIVSRHFGWDLCRLGKGEEGKDEWSKGWS